MGEGKDRSFMEIGSIYEISPDAAAGTDREAALPPLRLKEVEKYGKKYCRFTGSGREAIALALRSLEADRPGLNKCCLLPAYMCDSVFFPFLRAGWRIHFYHLDEELAADPESLGGQVEHIRPGLLFIHPYYGMDTWKPLRPLLPRWQAEGVCIMEDVTQSYYLETAGREADYVVGSLRKWYPIPDGGFVASHRPLPEALSDHREFVGSRLQVLTEKWEYLHGMGEPEEKRARKEDYLGQNRRLEEELDGYAGISRLSEVSARLLARTEEGECRRRREENHRFLLHKILHSPGIKESGIRPLPSRQEGAAPLYLAVCAGDRDGLQAYLRERNIFAPVLWPPGEENEGCLTEKERRVYDHLLALPIDQRYGQEEMGYIAGTLEEYGQTPVIGIRADANGQIGAGHIMRCITIAGQLIRRGARVLFFTADTYAHPMLEEAGLPYVCLHSTWNRMEEETEALKKELQQAGCRKLLVDSYQATERYFRSLEDSCALICMDDCFQEIYPVDMVINYNAYHTRFPYREAYGDRARLLLGTSYVPLREEFCPVLQKESGQPLQVLLSSGGGDVYNALSGILGEALGDGGQGKDTFREVIFHVVVGRFHEHRQELERLADHFPNIRLHYNVTEMAELMSRCQGAVSAAGTVLFELCAMEVPTVFFVSADNQQYDSEFFAREERMLFAGDIRTDRRGCLENICIRLQSLLADEGLRERMKKKLHEVTDGRGADRIAEEILRLKGRKA